MRLQIFFLYISVFSVVLGVNQAWAQINNPQANNTLIHLNVNQTENLQLPEINHQELLNWLVKGLATSYTYNYFNYRFQLKQAETYFTFNGWHQFKRLLGQSKIIPRLANRHLSVQFNLAGSPQIIGEGVEIRRHWLKSNEKHYYWDIQLPVRLLYHPFLPRGERMHAQNRNVANNNFIEAYALQVHIIRVPSMISPFGIAIDQISKRN